MGDLAFFHDMNVARNRHVGKNIRIMLIDNGKGTEFQNYCHTGAAFGDEADRYIAAAGHYGNKSPELVRHYAENLRYEYMSASNKEEFLGVYGCFLVPEMTGKPMLFEFFTDSKDESDALMICRNLTISAKGMTISIARKVSGKNYSKR